MKILNKLLFDCFRTHMNRFYWKRLNQHFDWFNFFQAYCISLVQLKITPDFEEFEKINTLFKMRQRAMVDAFNKVDEYKNKFYDRRDYSKEIKKNYEDKHHKFDSIFEAIELKLTTQAIEPYYNKFEEYVIERTSRGPEVSEDLDVVLTYKMGQSMA